MNSEVQSNTSRKVSWEALTYFNFYRFLVAFLFVSLYWIGQLPEPLGKYDRVLFAVSAHLYLVTSILAQLLVRLKTPTYPLQVFTNVLIDILIINLMMYASAGLNSGFGMLLVISVSAGSILSSGKTSILYASVASLSILGHEVYMQLTHEFPAPNYTHAGFLGITFFVTAFFSHRLASKVEVTEALAEQRSLDLKGLAQLNEHIVQRLQSGVVVLDDNLMIRLLNESAKRLMNIVDAQNTGSIVDLLPQLGAGLVKWRKNKDEQNSTIEVKINGTDLQVSFSQLNEGEKFETLIFLEEAALLRQRAQQMKLASLGRLTASIAHEVRNPLGAISHAGQLLSESNSVATEDKRLTDIIEQHSKRVNNIIENVLSISRQEQTVPTQIELRVWLRKFVTEFVARNTLAHDAVKLELGDLDVYARMDSGQLYQVLWNLCENGLRYGKSTPMLIISCSTSKQSVRPYIDISDSGTGIAKDVEEQLFEPFFTTNSAGTGLGLYIAKELCEANQAVLSLYENSKNGCTFRIIFSHLDKQHNFVQ